MNAIHDPFIHKLPPEIGSHIFRFSLPTLDDQAPEPWDEWKQVTEVLRLGAVCQKWHQLAWATLNLWELLYVNIGPPTERSLVESLPGLLSKWLSWSGMRPLTIFFQQYEDDNIYPFLSDKLAVETLECVTDLIIEIINQHSDRWRNLHLNVAANIPGHLCGSTQPNQLLSLELGIDGRRSPTQKFIMKSKPSPTQLTLFEFSPTSVDIGWDNITCANLQGVSVSECLELLRLAPALEYYRVIPDEDPTVPDDTATLHPRLRSLYFSFSGMHFLEMINIPSLAEWTHDTGSNPLSATILVSLFERSSCCLKMLTLNDIPFTSANFRLLLQAVPSLEYLWLYISQDQSHNGEMDDILARIFRSPSVTSAIPQEEITQELFLPRLWLIYCAGDDPSFAPFSWDLIPYLYRLGHRHSLTFQSIAYQSHINDEVSRQLLQLTDEGADSWPDNWREWGFSWELLGETFKLFFHRIMKREMVLLELSWNIMHLQGSSPVRNALGEIMWNEDIPRIVSHLCSFNFPYGPIGMWCHTSLPLSSRNPLLKLRNKVTISVCTLISHNRV